MLRFMFFWDGGGDGGCIKSAHSGEREHPEIPQGKRVVPMEEVKEIQDEESPASNPNKWLVWVFMKGPSCIRFSDVILSSGVEN